MRSMDHTVDHATDRWELTPIGGLASSRATARRTNGQRRSSDRAYVVNDRQTRVNK
jgi:hypothetical protein